LTSFRPDFFCVSKVAICKSKRIAFARFFLDQKWSHSHLDSELLWTITS
jgi:hypothetical protein